MKRLKAILKYIGDALLFALAVIVFIALVSTLALGALFLVASIGKLIGIGKDAFIYAVWFIAFWKAWDFFAWIVGKIADRQEKKKEREYFERLNINNNDK